jgi:hypothetical protein
MSRPSPTGTCPVCKRVKLTYRDRDGYGNERPEAPARMGPHAGPQWGRACAGSGQVCVEEAGSTH